MEPEIRFLAGDLEIRETANGLPELRGVVMKYGSAAKIGRMTERVQAGALTPDPSGAMLNFQHDRQRPLARTDGGGLELIDSAEAMTMRATLPKTTMATDALELVRAKVIRGLSVEMIVEGETWDGMDRTITAARMIGVALVDTPAYPESALEARWKAAQPRRPSAWRPYL